MFEKQFSQGGPRRSLEVQAEPRNEPRGTQGKISVYRAEGGYTSKVENEIRNFERQTAAIDEVLRSSE